MKQSVKLDAKVDEARTLANHGKLHEALETLNGVLAVDPKHGRARDGVRAISNALSAADPHRELRAKVIDHLKNGRASFALPLAQELTRIAPKDGPAFNLLGMSLGALLRTKEAAEAFERATRLAPKIGGHWYNLGKCRSELDQPLRAIEAIEKAHEVNPDHLPTALYLAATYVENACIEQSATLLAKLDKTYPQNVSILVNLSQSYYQLGLADKALAVVERGLAVAPKFPALLVTKSQILRAMGDFDGARAACDAALADKPDFAPAHLGRSSVTKYSEDDPQIAALEALVKKQDAPVDEQASYWFALAKAYEDTKKLDQAFDAYLKANAARKQSLNKGMEFERSAFASLKQMPIGQWPKVTRDDKRRKFRPVFILGLPRSGTTLVEQILSRHPLVSPAGEMPAFGQIASQHFGQLVRGPLPQTLAEMRAAYFSRAHMYANGRSVITDKMPANFRWIGIIRACIPEARIIHMTRDPMAVAWSIFKRNLSGNGNRFAFDLDDIAEYSHMHRDLMAHWHATCPDFILDVNYEELTANPEPEIRKLLAHAKLDWNVACLSPEDSKRAVITSSDTQVRKGIYAGSSQDWRKFESQLKPYMAKFPPQ